MPVLYAINQLLFLLGFNLFVFIFLVHIKQQVLINNLLKTTALNHHFLMMALALTVSFGREQ